MARKKIIQLPKGYISYSQKQLWKNDPKRYRELYFNFRDDLRIDNSGMKYGKIVAEALENEEETDDLLTDAAMFLLKKYDIRDQEIQAEIKTRDGLVSIIGRPDTLDSVTKNFREYKTGKGKWTLSKAQKHPQMKFYAMLVYLAYGVALKEAYLDWIETEDYTLTDKDGNVTERGIRPTGHVESFRVTFTLTDILEEMADTSKVAKEIEIAYASHVRPPEDVF